MDSIVIKNNINRMIILTCICFFLFSLYYGVTGFKEDIAGYLLILEYLFAFIYGSALFLSISKKKKSINGTYFLVVLFYSLFASLLIRYLFIECTGNIFQEASDSYGYDEEAKYSVMLNRDLKGHLYSINNSMYNGLNIDDYGFNAIIFGVYSLFGIEMGQWMMLVLNSICIMISTFYMTQILKLLSINKTIVVFSSALFAYFTFFPVTAAVGLKENLFVLPIIMYFYHSIQFKQTAQIRYLILAIAFLLCTFFFRLAIGAMLLISLLLLFIINKKNHRRILFFFLIGGLVFFFILGTVFEKIFGVSIEHILAVSEYRIGEENSLGWFIQFIASLFGPFPNYNRAVQYGIISSFALQIKCILNLLVVFAIYKILKKGDYSLYWICFFYLMGVLMLTMAAVSLDMRYHVTFFPIFIMLVAYCLNNIKIPPPIYLTYSFFIISLIYFYNSR